MREKTLKRDALIYKQFLKGTSKTELAEKFQITKKSINQIISSQKARNHASLENERLLKTKAFHRRVIDFRNKIDIGDVLVVEKYEVSTGKSPQRTKITGEVIYKNKFFVTIRGDDFVESFDYMELSKKMVSHFK
ncbi:MAG: hypothetical protein PUG66_08165 [Clostridiales bacterium]|nr:hypothetical protein [Clostridiales bacterium]